MRSLLGKDIVEMEKILTDFEIDGDRKSGAFAEMLLWSVWR